ncbi:DEAD/DEAH box helicase [Sodiomyces alkalinus F11]|uniref:RNA helicase n=1 Tax=Sodiomyces alkalinus (strain CBS 110278 / VKM F-3762 / F11) TaxID=1314773 RepID=A0A3N2Q4W1_SODAK|nr:DEAD/DEAH box helicase [Sodiomyces alkalinus F11]ROT41810.1 DEAD/DEAH box helicase [Sodiomyces alkalinus F11]
MAPREVSPTPSDAGVDIGDSLFGQGWGTGTDNGGAGKDADVDMDQILNGADDDDDDGDEAFIALQQAASFRKASNLKGKSVKKGGGFQAMGLNSNLLRAITRKGFSVPTPIQRKTIPLIMDRRDVVGMARTGSGKTAAFVVPMIERLKAHSAKFGARALILSPSRELAIQTLRVVKDFNKGTDLKAVLLVGGDSMEEQFGLLSANPDIIIATPGRFLHLKVEMSLNLSSIQYVVFDEADRLFEMGFAAQLTEILHALPPSRQSLLFSATLPSSLVEFARAGLQDPTLVRLDAETKVSPDLESAFFSVKGDEKEAALLYILHQVIKMPLGTPDGVPLDVKPSKKRKRGKDGSTGKGKPTEHSTIVFAATKHHVEYLAGLLRQAGFAVSYVYGSLDQEARRINTENFRQGRANVLVVTDVAARGIDIPVLANVINYDFPPQPKVFVHRVGRTARAGQRGWAYSIVRELDTPYLLDLQLFLGRKFVVGQESADPSFAEDIVVGALPHEGLEIQMEWLAKTLGESADIAAIRDVSVKAEKLYLKTRHSASSQSAKRAREIVASNGWTQRHPLFGKVNNDQEQARAALLAKISGYKPQETIFEIGRGGKGSNNEAAEMMKQLRKRIVPHRGNKKEEDDKANHEDDDVDSEDADEVEHGSANNGRAGSDAAAGQWLDDGDDGGDGDDHDDDHDDDDDDNDGLEVTVSNPSDKKKGEDAWRDSEVFMSYTPRTINAAEERGYGVQSGAQGSSFVEQARDAAMDFNNDDAAKGSGEPAKKGMRWDKKQNKYVARANDEDGSKGAKYIRGESGTKIAASFQSGRFEKWRRANRLGKLRVGEMEKSNAPQLPTGPRYKHKQEKAPKEADKYRDDYEVRKKRIAEAKEKRVGKYKDGAGSRKEIKGANDIRKARVEKEKRRAKNARPSRK